MMPQECAACYSQVPQATAGAQGAPARVPGILTLSREAGEVITVEDRAEVRRLHRAEGLPIKEIARPMSLARNSVRGAPRTERPPRYDARHGVGG